MAETRTPARRASRTSRWCRSMALLGAVVGLGSLAGSAAAAPLAGATTPPGGTHNIIVFPQRDFVSADGYADGDLVVVHVIEPDGTVISTDPANPIAAQGGLVEVNHPGGACWNVNTPDIRPGDIVQVDIVGGPNAGTADATTVRNITAKRPVSPAPGVIEVHGTAQDSFTAVPGNPLPVGELEQRIVAPGSLFDLNHRRTLRATSVGVGSEGVLSYDPIDASNPNGINWTARYDNLSDADVALALGAESRGMWLGPTATETTVYEIGALTVGGPAAPCTAPLQVRAAPPGSELVPPSDPTNLTGTFNGVNKVTLSWDASTDNVGVTAYGIYRNGQAIFTVSNPDGSAPAPTTFVESNLPPGDYTFQVRAFDEVGNASELSNTAGPFTAIAQLDVNTFPVNDPPSLPINIIAFPSRDFISPSGYEADDTVTVQLLRKDASGQMNVISSADGIIPVDGFAEVNHPGGACWQGQTPEIRTGDVVRTIAYNPASRSDLNPDGIRSIDQTTIAGVTTYRPVVVTPATPGNNDGVVEIHGTALGANGKPLPIDQIEQRMIATHGVGLWDLNNRRALRADSAGAGDGLISYDADNNPMGVKWTARYQGLDQADVARMADADTRIHWLGRDPLLLNEATIFENADGNPPGPAGPGCTRPLEAADVTAPTAPGSLGVTQTGPDTVQLDWSSSTDDWYVYGYRIFRDGVAVANVPAGTLTYTMSNVPAGAHTYTVKAFDSASPRGIGPTIIEQLVAGFGDLYGNLSAPGGPVDLLQADVTAPSTPKDVVAVSGVGMVSLTWSASTDDVAVDHYNVYRDTVLVTATSGTTIDDTGLAVGSYSYRVEAVDAAGNTSAQSAAVVANVTEVPDVTAPSVPSVLASVPDVRAHGVTVTWTASTDLVGTTGYHVYRDGTLIATLNGSTLSFSETRPAGTYAYTVDAFDSAGNTSAQSDASTAVVANDPPLAPASIIAFPARDFVSAVGVPGDTYHFEILRNGVVAFTTQPQAAAADGVIEVNHPGGTCWNVRTPNIKTGDLVRLVDETTGVADQTIVMGVTAGRPIATSANTVVIHGTAVDQNGDRLPIDQIEQRLVANRDLFELNGRRTLRAASAGADGTLSYDSPTSTHWTATYTGMSAIDVVRAAGGTIGGQTFIGAESRGHWLGRDPLALLESTIFENGSGVVGGPANPPCSAVAEPGYPAASLNSLAMVFPATEFVPVQTESAAQSVILSNGGSSTLHISDIYIAGVNPGDFRILPTSTCGATLAAGAICSVNVAFKPTAQGPRQAALEFLDDAANTTDQSVRLTGSGLDRTDPILTRNPASLLFGTVNGGFTKSLTLTVTNTGTGQDLVFTAAPSISGANAADFTVVPGTGTTCLKDVHLAAGGVDSCFVTVKFTPGARAARSANLVLAHNRLKTTAATSTSVALTGTGGNGAVITFGSNPVKFGTVTRNTTKDQTISVKNSGNAAATGLAIAVATTTAVPPGTGYTLRSTTCGTTLAISGSCSVVVRMTAPNQGNLTVDGTLTITTANGIPLAATAVLNSTTK